MSFPFLHAQFDSILQKVNSDVPGPKPTHIFEVVTSADSVPEEKFRNHQCSLSSIFAYHGSKLEYFHSILNYGLQQHLCKVSSINNKIDLSFVMY